MLQRETEHLACQVRLAPHGIEVDLVRSGAVMLTRVFETDDEALEWAREKRVRREAEGWRPLPLEMPSDQTPIA
jgi:hypothetical protein